MPTWRVSDSSDGEGSEDPSPMDVEDTGESDGSINEFEPEARGAKLNVDIWKPNLFLYPARTSLQSNRLM